MSLGISFTAQPYTKQDLKAVRKVTATAAAMPAILSFVSNDTINNQSMIIVGDVSDHIAKIMCSALEGGEDISKLVKVLKAIQSAAPKNKTVFSKDWGKDEFLNLGIALSAMVIVDFVKSTGGKFAGKTFVGDQKRIVRRIINATVETLAESSATAAGGYALLKYGNDPKASEAALDIFKGKVLEKVAYGVVYNIAGEVIARGAQDDTAEALASLQDLVALVKPNVAPVVA